MLYVNKAQWRARFGNTMNEIFMERNKMMSKWCIFLHNKKLWMIDRVWELEQSKNEFFFENGKDQF